MQDFSQQQQQQHKFDLGDDFRPRLRLLSTGTTIAGVCGYDQDGQPYVVLGADTRATAGRMVADKSCQKIHPLASNIYCCGAGTSADLDQLTRHCRYTLALRSLHQQSAGNSPQSWEWETERPARHSATMAATCRFLRDVLYEAGGSIGANLIVGGIDIDQETPLVHLKAIHPHGSLDNKLPYAALGSGGLAAMAVLESRYHPNMTLTQAIQIVKEAILSGILNDMGSGSQVDLCVISVNQFGKVVSNYTRAALPEERLEELEVGSISSQQQARAKSLSTPGVNGFGNYPFSTRSQRLIVPSRQAEAQNRAEVWKNILGQNIQTYD